MGYAVIAGTKIVARSTLLLVTALGIGVASVAAPAGSLQQADASGWAGVGPVDAPVTIIEYTDFASEPCRRLHFMLKALFDAYPQSLRVVVRQDPIADDRSQWLAHEAALAAGMQGKFWEMTDMIFANQGRHERGDLIAMAERLGVDVAQFTAGLDTGQFQVDVDRDRREAASKRLKGVPVYFLNGERQAWPVTFDVLKRRVSEIMNRTVP